MTDLSRTLCRNLNNWHLVFSVLEEGSVAKAAMKNGMDRAQLSRLITQMEKEIGRPLLIRKGRKISPTQLALEAKESLQRIVQQFDDRLAEIVHDQNRLKGNIRIGGMPGFMQEQVVPLLVEFQKSYPDILFDVVCNEDPEALLNGQCDVMLYYGPRPRKGLVEHWVTRSLFVACAAPEYLADRGTPKAPADLAQHSGIIFTGNCRPHSDILKLWQEETHYRWKSQLRFNNILSAKTAAVKGAGVMLDCPAHHGYQDILKGNLVPILNGWHVPNLENYIGTTEESATLKRVTTFVEWYIRRRREIEGEMIQRLQRDFGVMVS